MNGKSNLVRQVLLYVLLMILLLRQFQLQREIDHLQTAFVEHGQQMIEFMKKTNGSVENLSQASVMNSRAIVKLAEK